MSPINAMERSYSALKHMLREGAFPAGSRLEANRLADDLSVSMTPVRDALHCLNGERLVEATIGEGFRVPQPSEQELRDLYEWHSALLSMASRTIDVRAALGAPMSDSGVADHFAAIIMRIAGSVPNRELGVALSNVSDRLHPYRITEARIFEDLGSELEVLQHAGPGLLSQIRRYHTRRMRSVAELIRERDRR